MIDKHVLSHNREIAVKKAQASRVVYCELIREGESTELILKKTFFIIAKIEEWNESQSLAPSYFV